MRVLLTNDDGTASDGLWALARAVREAGHDVVVVAPVTNQSGTAASLGAGDFFVPTTMTRVENDDHLEAWGLDATPAKCVLLAVQSGMVGRIDAVASGINPGLNHGVVVMHSGTVGAALTAAGLRVPAVAVSIAAVAPDQVAHWDTAGRLGALLVDVAVHHPGRVVNVNLPDVPFEQLRVAETPLSPYWPASLKLEGTFPPRQGQLHVAWTPAEVPAPEGSDVAVVADAASPCATVTLLTPVTGLPDALAGDLAALPGLPGATDLTQGPGLQASSGSGEG